MALQVWLPLRGNTDNQGLTDCTIVNNGATVNDNGKIGKCYSFNGTSNYIKLKNPITKSNLEFTISCWIKFNNIVDTQTIYTARTAVGNGIAVFLIGGKIRFDDNTQTTFNNTPSFGTTWNHICITRNSSAKKLYINGKLIEISTTVGDMSNIGANGTIGGSETSDNGVATGNWTSGYMNDFRIYTDKCLSAKEIKHISQGMIAHYPLNDRYVEPTTNLLKYPTPSGTPSYSWDSSKHLDAVVCSGWSGGYNSGVSSPEKGYHAMWKVIDDVPTIVFQNLNSKIGITNRWLGVSSSFSGLNANTTYTISMEIKSSVAGQLVSTGVYYNKAGNTTYGFHDGCKSVSVNTTWKTYTWTYTTSAEFNPNATTNPTKSNIYVYGYEGAEGVAYVRNIQLEVKNHATPYTPDSRLQKTVYDTSGYSNNGEVSSTTAPSTVGNSPRYSNCCKFDGTNDLINIPNLTLKSVNSAYTIAMWCNLSATGTMIFGTKNSNGLNVYTAGSKLSWNYSGNGTTNAFPNFTYSLNQWYHFAIVVDSSTVKLYVNGAYISSCPNYVALDTVGLVIGRYGASANYFYKGLMSDVRIYTTALSAEDVKELYNAPISITKTNSLITQGEVVEL